MLTDAVAAIEYYLAHRAGRLEQVRAALAAGARTPREVVERVYADVDPALWPAAELSVRAQLDYLADAARVPPEPRRRGRCWLLGRRGRKGFSG